MAARQEADWLCRSVPLAVPGQRDGRRLVILQRQQQRRQNNTTTETCAQ